MFERGVKRRARRALERQLEYQRAKAQRIAANEPAIVAARTRRARAIRTRLEA